MSRWFRFHADALNNPKVQRLDGDTFKAWVNLLCLASQAGGVLPTSGDIAFALRITEEAADELVDKLVRASLLDESEQTGLRPHGWDEHQYRSDVSTDRVRRYRNKSETFPKRSETVSETAPEQNRTDTEQRQNRTEQTRVRVREMPRAQDLAQPSQRFEEFWTLYPRKWGKDDAARDWVNYVSVENEAAVFACLKRYLESAEVRRGAVMNPGSSVRDLGWIAKCARDQWKSDWGKARDSPADSPVYKTKQQMIVDQIDSL